MLKKSSTHDKQFRPYGPGWDQDPAGATSIFYANSIRSGGGAGRATELCGAGRSNDYVAADAVARYGC